MPTASLTANDPALLDLLFAAGQALSEQQPFRQALTLPW
jgi:hypothetical protein